MKLPVHSFEVNCCAKKIQIVVFSTTNECAGLNARMHENAGNCDEAKCYGYDDSSSIHFVKNISGSLEIMMINNK